MWTALKLAFGVATGGVGTFLSAALSWAVANWKLVLMLLAIAGAGITYKVLVDERDTARATVAADVTTIKTLGSQIDALQAAQVSLEQHIAVQDSSIATMKKDSSDAQQRATDAMHTASQQSKKDASTIATLQKRAADPTNKGTCDAELYRIRTGL